MPLTADQLGHATRRISPYSSSHRLEELDAECADGTRVALVLKAAAVDARARGAKPAFLVEPSRERRVYEDLLPEVGNSVPCLWGEIEGALLLERIDGAPLTEVGDRTVWEEAMRTLARLHASLPSPGTTPLVRYDCAFYNRWLERALAFVGPDVGAFATAHALAVERLSSMPQGVIHGELYASNVIATDGRICVVDWETAALGPAVVDVAALTSGSWTDEEREALALAYLEGLPSATQAKADFLVNVTCARLHLAVQWLGWSDSWTPPPGQAQDWLEEARRAAERIR